ncbi:MAG: transposase domain-containing protein [Acetobacteraceae bacterium]
MACRNDIHPFVWLADVFARIALRSQSRLHELPPWNWKQTGEPSARAA